MVKVAEVKRAGDVVREGQSASFVAAWLEIDARDRLIDYERGRLVATWVKKVGEEETTRMLVEDVGLGPPRLLRVKGFLAAVAAVPNKKTWAAVGTVWTLRLATVEDEVERLRIEKTWLDAAAREGHVLQDNRVKEILRSMGTEAATALLPKPKKLSIKNGGDAIFRTELERLVRAGELDLAKIDKHVAKVGRFAELLEEAKRAEE